MTKMENPFRDALLREAMNSQTLVNKPRPVFGSPEVAKYGAVGLDEKGEFANKVTPKTNTEEGKKETFQISPNERLQLIENLAHHLVDNYHLWIAVDDGKLIVTNDNDNLLMYKFVIGASPIEAAAELQDRLMIYSEKAWTDTLTFLGRLAAAGLIKGIKGYHSVKKARPYSFARFHLTQRCQLECVHCYTSSGPYLPSNDELSTERWIKLVNDFVDNGGQKILFTGGEALVHKGCIDIMREAHSLGLEVTLFSNGILIPKFIDQLQEVADIVQISVDGPSEQVHDSIRGKGSFRKAIAAIHLLLDRGIKTRMSTTIMMINWLSIKEDFPKLIEEFENTELSFRISYGAMAHGRGTNLDHSLDTQEVRKFVDGLLSRIKTTENREEGVNIVQKITGCGYAEQLVIAPDGLVYPCHLLSGALGHVDDLPMNEITNYLMRTAEAFSVKNRVGCGTCDLRNLCGGSCRVEDEKHTMSRLITTCTDTDKLRKKRFLVNRYKPVTS